LTVQVGKLELANWHEGIKREWLLTNGLGGYASGTAVGMNTRRYHGLLMAALEPPGERTLLVAKTEDLLGGVPLDCNLYSGEVIHPEGQRQLESFSRGKRPTFRYRAGGLWLEKSIFMVQGANLTIVQYQLLEPSGEARLTVRPLITHRHFHHLMQQNHWPFAQSSLLEGKGVEIEAYSGAAPIYLLSDRASYSQDSKWYQNFLYTIERERGLDSREDLFSPGYFHLDLKPGERVAFAFATPKPRSEIVDNLAQDFHPGHAQELWRQELARRDALIEQAQTIMPLEGRGKIEVWARDLVLAADSFIVSRGEGRRTIIAGYPWFGDWGRDTMIALEGLTLITGRFAEAWEILTSFAHYCEGGLLPNCFPDVCADPAYNSVDAPLWFIHAVYRYWQYTRADEVRELYPTVRSIVEHYIHGTTFGIGMDQDCLIKMDNGQLTWMDAKVGEWVVTPRAGKPIEIQALWYNALLICSKLAELAGEDSQGERELAAKVQKSAEKYWDRSRGFLADLLGTPQLRPNQFLAFSLPHPLFDPGSPRSREMAQSVLVRIMEELYIGPGLRSLGPGEPLYRGHYGGDQYQRDAAYHQGTAWSWPLGPFLDLVAKLEPDLDLAREKLWLLLEPSLDHFYREGALGQIAEIFTGDWPHEPRGCFAQAWGVAEILRIVGTYLLSERGWQHARDDA